MKTIDRRQFLTTTTAGGLGLVMLGGRAIARNLPDMAVATGEDPAAITRAAIEALGGIGRFVSKGDKVLVKPNIGWDRMPEQAAGTNPQVVAALVRVCLEAGAAKVTVLDNTISDARRCYARSGIYEAATAAGAEMPFVISDGFRKVDMGGTVLKNWLVYGAYLDSDVLINVPIAKHHSLSRLTMGMKNLYGLIGGPRQRLHQRLADGLVDLTAYFKPQLTVLDAYRILVRNGPQGGRASDTELRKMVIAGTDPIAVDARGAELFGIAGADLDFIRLGAERGLGTYDLSKLTIREVSG
jgi:uncharacterized protein (DUF362 family)